MTLRRTAARAAGGGGSGGARLPPLTEAEELGAGGSHCTALNHTHAAEAVLLENRVVVMM